MNRRPAHKIDPEGPENGGTSFPTGTAVPAAPYAGLFASYVPEAASFQLLDSAHRLRYTFLAFPKSWLPSPAGADVSGRRPVSTGRAAAKPPLTNPIRSRRGRCPLLCVAGSHKRKRPFSLSDRSSNDRIRAGRRTQKQTLCFQAGRKRQSPVSLKKPSRRPHEHAASSPDGSKCVKPFSRLHRTRRFRRPSRPIGSAFLLFVWRRRMPLLRFKVLFYFIMQAEKSKQENAARVDFFFLL